MNGSTPIFTTSAIQKIHLPTTPIAHTISPTRVSYGKLTLDKNFQKFTKKVLNPTNFQISDWMVQLLSLYLKPFKRYTSPPLPLHTLSVQHKWVMGSWLWTKIFRFQHKRYVILLIFKFLIESCNSWVSILSRSRDTVTKKWSCEPYTRLYIVELVAFDARGWPAITAKVASAIANQIAAFQRLHHRMKTLKCCNFWTVAAMNLIFSQNTFLWYPLDSLSVNIYI